MLAFMKHHSVGNGGEQPLLNLLKAISISDTGPTIKLTSSNLLFLPKQ